MAKTTDIDIYAYHYGDRIKLGTAKKDSLDGRYYMEIVEVK